MLLLFDLNSVIFSVQSGCASFGEIVIAKFYMSRWKFFYFSSPPTPGSSVKQSSLIVDVCFSVFWRIFSCVSHKPWSQKLLRSPRKPMRKISKIPFKVLDAPELQDDFYLNLVDWSSLNVLSVGLGTCVYLWSACTSQVCARLMRTVCEERRSVNCVFYFISSLCRWHGCAICPWKATQSLQWVGQRE